ncbi:Methyltransferase-like protein 25 [Lamellibrachia satsuma]|nr:Methyltransferase-like protein 25 [Lamellibrachia satsuma]
MNVNITNPVDNLEAIVEFCIRYQWVYDLQLTKYFVDKAWEKIPPDWKDPLTSLTQDELNAFPHGFFKESCPESLKEFIQTSHTLSLPRSPLSCHMTRTELDKNMRKGMNPKKIHEVSQMAGVVDKLCRECGVQHIIDIGSGLGYLGQVLSADYGYKVLGLEGVETRSHDAEKQAMKKELSNTDFRSITFTLHNTDECFVDFQQMLHDELLCKESTKPKEYLAEEEIIRLVGNTQKDSQLSHGESPVLEKHQSDEAIHPLQCECCGSTDHLCYQGMTQKTGVCNCAVASGRYRDYEQTLEPEHRKASQGTRSMPLCMIGLHCCADLTPTMLHLLTRMPDIACLVCVGCCYHNMTKAGSHEYNCFPMSSKLQAVMKCAQEKHPDWRLNTYALRLAAQETRARWQKQTVEDHKYHVKNVAFRGIIELFCQTEHCELNKTRRRVARQKDYDSFDTYLAAVFDRAALSGNQDMTFVLKKLQDLYCAHEPYVDFIEPFTALQMTLQPVLESLIIIDRLQFLREHDLSATAVPIFNEEISPRNLALIGWKN